ncbi:hypothetical protein [Streptomyces sp. NPDC003273]|uniref:hypothetical protein n=1 Tax=Streptomyces sp. NPDC003273 TaxID=3364678 RepID=UPI003676A7A7
MTTAIMTRPAAPATLAAVNPEYACGRCNGWHAAGSCPAAAHHQLGDLLARMVREADARIPDGRRARRTLQEMMPGFQRQPVLTLHRPEMADDACPVCGYWRCRCSEACTRTPAAAAPAPVRASGGWQCDTCGGWFGVTGARPGTVTAWTCSACQNLGS